MDEYDYGYEQEGPSQQKTLRGYQIIIVVLAVILFALTFIYFRQMRNQREDFDIERRELNDQFASLMGDYEGLRTTNDTINMQLGLERMKADSLMESLANERNLSRAKIKQYEKELGTLRTVMREYVHQIDSLNTLNKTLISENVEYRQQVTSERLARAKAEETSAELSAKVRRGQVVNARDIVLTPLNRNDREVTRANRAERLRVDFVLAANELAQPGERAVYVRIIGPENFLLTTNTGALFDFEGEMTTYSAMREVDYQNDDLGVSLYYNGGGITAGTYRIEVFFDGNRVGSREILLR